MKKTLWGGRFKKGMHSLLREYSYSLLTDSELLSAELRVNRAYAKMLAKIGVLKKAEAQKLIRGCDAIEKSWNPGDACKHHQDFEDVHTLIQQELERRVGAVGKKIHTGRSRNDLVVTSTLIFLKEKLALLDSHIQHLQEGLLLLAQKAGDTIFPGMTHLRKAQPVLLAHHLLAYIEMLETDRERFRDAAKRMNVLPLGSAALAGSALPLAQSFLVKELGFERAASNSMAATSDRAFIAETLSAYSILWMHLSRLSEDFILWNSEAFGFIELDDAFSTGSSLMPQKKNPDVFELTRGRAGVVFGCLQAALTLQKGLPLAYNRDLQEDKPALFRVIRKTEIALPLLALTIATASIQKKAMAKALNDEGLYATDILEYLIRKKVPFAAAHEAVGKLVRASQDQNRSLKDFSMREWRAFSQAFDLDVYDLLDPAASVSGKKTAGSTHPARVKQAINKWKRILR